MFQWFSDVFIGSNLIFFITL